MEERGRASIAFAQHLLRLRPPRGIDAIAVLLAFAPPPSMAAEYLIVLAEVKHWLLTDLITAGDPDGAAAMTVDVVGAYRAAAAVPGADVLRVGRGLARLSAEVANTGRFAAAVGPQQAVVDVLAAAPAAGQALEHTIMLAEGRYVLVLRLIDDRRVDDAVALVDPALTDFRTYTAMPGADPLRAARDLGHLSSQVANAGRTTPAVTAQQAVVDLLDTATVDPALVTEHAIMLAEGRYVLILRLIDDHRVDDAVTLVDQTITDFRTYTALPGADPSRARNNLLHLAAQLTNAGRPAEATRAKEAADAVG